MSSLSELIERVEKASGPDRRIDAAICRVIDLPKCEEPDCLPDVYLRNIERVESGGDDEEIQAYTYSIDAALTLLPEGLLFYVDSGTNRLSDHCHACVHEPVNKRMSGGAYGATPVLALVAACLKARLAMSATEARHD
jgi:hypothetical protein